MAKMAKCARKCDALQTQHTHHSNKKSCSHHDHRRRSVVFGENEDAAVPGLSPRDGRVLDICNPGALFRASRANLSGSPLYPKQKTTHPQLPQERNPPQRPPESQRSRRLPFMRKSRGTQGCEGSGARFSPCFQTPGLQWLWHGRQECSALSPPPPSPRECKVRIMLGTCKSPGCPCRAPGTRAR